MLKQGQLTANALDQSKEYATQTLHQTQKSRDPFAQRVTKGEAVVRRKAYDAQLKTDIMLSGRDKSMNKTYDPFYHPYWAAPPVTAAGANTGGVSRKKGKSGDQGTLIESGAD